MENVTLSELFLLNLQREGLIRTPTDKYQHGYMEGFYDEFLEKFRDRPINFLEIGTWYGGSMELWPQYFHEESVIYGADIQQRFDPVEGTETITENMYDPQAADKFPDEYFDLIIDDGLHSPEAHDQLAKIYYPKIKKGGTLIVEDIFSRDTIDPLTKLCYSIGYSDVQHLDFMGKNKVKKDAESELNYGGPHILNITK
tara:strand:- start:145 stop:741 length:597 start_codon:yes stop_codon:yes gene_type:complete